VRDLVKMGLILALVCALSAAALAVVNMVTMVPIARQAEIERREAFQRVMPNAEDFRVVSGTPRWEALKGGAAVGTVISLSTQGYSGAITFAIGLDRQNRLTGVRVLSHTETPGLGARITGTAFVSQFTGLGVEGLKLKKDDPAAGRVDAITAATISSRAVTNAVRAAVESAAKEAR
jgi:Na+-translocating ferredoxin:NAD+ oxidoreductase subunit G